MYYMRHMEDKSELATHGDAPHPPRKMASLRLSNDEDPDRHERISQKLKDHGSSLSIFGRALFDALERHIDEHDKLPKLPLRVETETRPIKPPKK